MLPSHSAVGWCAWAWAEYGQGHAERALEGFGQAVACDPNSIAAQFGLATVLFDAGDVPGATALSDEIMVRAPHRPDAIWLHARLAVSRGDYEVAHVALATLIADMRIDPPQRAEALLLLGTALGEIGRNAEAFGAAASGKALLRAIHARQAAEREGEIAKLGRLTAWIERTSSHHWQTMPLPATAHEAQTHVFLIGFPRSGTTLLEQVLAGHPRVRTLEEAPTLATAYAAFLADTEGWATLSKLPPEEALLWRAQYWADVRAHRIDAAGCVFVDKQPAGTLYLPLIAKIFPGARILFALRDPRDVVLSCFRNAFKVNAMTYAFTTLADTAACYDACMTLAERCRERLPVAWLDTRHEALVEDFDCELARIAGFLGLETDARMADVAAAAKTRTIRTPSAAQVRAGLNRRGLGRWRDYANELAPVSLALRPWIERFDYRA